MVATATGPERPRVFDSPSRARGSWRAIEGGLTMDWRDYITVDPSVCHGQACIAGTRVMVTVILDNLAAGLSPAEIAESYPTVSVEAVQAVLQYAAELARERTVPLGA